MNIHSRCYWMYKCNVEGGPAGWGGDWELDVFINPNPQEWGGHFSTLSPEAKRHVSSVRPGDVMVCYQTDRKVIVGYCRVTKIVGPVDDKILYLQPIHELPKHCPIHKHKAGTILEDSLAVNSRIMLRPLSKAEAREIGRITNTTLT